MHFQHADAVWAEHPDLTVGTLHVTGLHAHADPVLDRFEEIAQTRLAGGTEADLPEIQAWRRTFARMGLPPTRYRCASEALLRRFRKDGALPRIHPVIDLCNAVSLAFAIPVGVLDVARIAEFIEVRHADGSEEYLTFGGDTEKPDPGEVIFADAGNRAHSRRWTNRQSGHSAVRDPTRAALVVVEAMHATAATDVPRLIDTLAEALSATWGARTTSARLTRSSSRFTFTG